MSAFAWINEIEEVSPLALTVLAQAISPNDKGKLKYLIFFPKKEVPSVDLEGIEALDYRPTSDRRAWNQRGRLIPTKTPNKRKVSIVPVEGNYLWGEYELQKLMEQTLGNQKVIAEIMQSTVPGKVRQITQANYRRIEVDAFQVWANNSIIQKNPQTGELYTTSFGFDTARYQTAGTAWNDPGLNSYDELTSWIDDAIDAIGGIQGVVCRRNFIREIQADAPDLAGGAKMTFEQLEERIRQDKGTEFKFYPMEDTVELFDDGGTATTKTKVWTAEKIAAVPVGAKVGNTAFAPVVRAMDVAKEDREKVGVSVNGQTVYYEEHTGGRELSVEVQVNALSVPEESNLYVIDVGF